MGYFLPFYISFPATPYPPPSNNPDNQNFEKIKEAPGDIIILNMSNINKNQKLNDVWFLRYGAQPTDFFLILNQFLPFYCSPQPPTTPPTQQPKELKFWKKKKNATGIIILHKCTINDKHMIYGSWDINCNKQIFFVILGNFLLFQSPNDPKNENFKKK